MKKSILVYGAGFCFAAALICLFGIYVGTTFRYMFCILTKTLYQANQYYEKCVCSKIHLNRNCIRTYHTYNIEPFIEAGFYCGAGGAARFWHDWVKALFMLDILYYVRIYTVHVLSYHNIYYIQQTSWTAACAWYIFVYPFSVNYIYMLLAGGEHEVCASLLLHTHTHIYVHYNIHIPS